MKFQGAANRKKEKIKLACSNLLSKFKKKNCVSIFLSFVIFAFIFLLSGYVLTTTILDTSVRTTISLICLIVNLIVFIFLVDFQRLKSEIRARQIPASYIILLILGFSTVLTMFATRDFSNFIAYAGHGIIIINGFLISRFLSPHAFIKTFCNLVFGLTVIGLIFYLFYIIGGLNPSPLPVLANSTEGKYANFLFLSFQLLGLNRFSGFVWEPGLMAAFLIEALAFELIFEKKTNLLHFSVFTIALILTFSTFAYIVYFLVVLIALNRWIKNRKVFIGICIGVGVAAIVCIAFYDQVINLLATIMPSVFGKFVYSYSGASLTTRIYSPYIDFLIFLKSPLWGVGLSDFDQMYSDYVASGQFPLDGSQTSTTFSLMGQFGIFGLTSFVGLSIGIGKNKKIHIFNRIVLILIFFLILNTEPHNKSLIDWCFLFVFLRAIEKNQDKDLLFEEPSKNCLWSSIRRGFSKKEENNLIKTEDEIGNSPVDRDKAEVDESP